MDHHEWEMLYRRICAQTDGDLRSHIAQILMCSPESPYEIADRILAIPEIKDGLQMQGIA